MSIISIDLKADFGFFKKPDINDSLYLTYNFIHKPVLLGLFGAILGYAGHKENKKLPEYYEKLQDLKIGIEPLCNEKKHGNFEKILVRYNDATGFSNSGATLNVLEQVLVKPAYRIFIELNEEHKLYQRLKSETAVFIPYFGKNEFHCWWENFQVYTVKNPIELESFQVKTIFTPPKGETTLVDLENDIEDDDLNASEENQNNSLSEEKEFSQFERLPIDFNTDLYQYNEAQVFVYSNLVFQKTSFLEKMNANNFYELEREGRKDVIYLF